MTVYQGDWNKLLCNGCYGRLLSIYDIKAGTAPDDERAEALATLLLTLVSKDTQEEAMKHLRVAEQQANHLSDRTLRFLATSEAVSKSLVSEPNLDWSPAVIGLCKAVECEIQERILIPLRQSLRDRTIENDLKDHHLKRVASYCSGKSEHPPELGPIRYFLTDAASRGSDPTSGLLTTLRQLVIDWPNSDWLFAKDGLVSSLDVLTSKFRNPAAHAEELGRGEYDDCHTLVIGSKGLLWRLITATQGRK
jgi:hypothetical protein